MSLGSLSKNSRCWQFSILSFICATSALKVLHIFCTSMITSLKDARLRCFIILTKAASMRIQRSAETSTPRFAAFSVYLGTMMQPTLGDLYLKSWFRESYYVLDSILTGLPVLTKTPYLTKFSSELLKKGSSSIFNEANRSPYLAGRYSLVWMKSKESNW